VEIRRSVSRTARRISSTCTKHRREVAIGALLLLLISLVPVASVLRYVHFDSEDLPDIEPFIRFELPTTGEVLDSQGELLIEFAREYRQLLSYDELPEILRQAILAAEDRTFFSHRGVAYSAFPRVVQKSVTRSFGEWWRGEEAFRLRFPQGGSTITQQLVRGFFLQDRIREESGQELFREGAGAWTLSMLVGVPTANKLLRKLEEVRLALWLEKEMERRFGSRRQAKREILSRYASFIYLGHGRYGYAAASEYYFGRHLSSYTAGDAGDAALLAGIGKSPHVYAPRPGNPESLRRRDEILLLMAENGFIADDLAQRARAGSVRVASRDPIKTRAPAVIGGVLTEMRLHGGSRFGVEDLLLGRVQVRTTVDLRLQNIVNQALETGLELYEARHPGSEGVIQGSVVVLRNRDAAVLAMSGGRSVYQGVQSAYSDFNRATESLRQPGSAWKPIVYMAAFRSGLGLDSMVSDEPTRVGSGAEAHWVANYDGRFHGPISVRQALAESRNTVAIRLAQEVGLYEMRRVAWELGVTSPVHPYMSSALGASEVRLVELAGAYRAVASGVLAVPHVVDHVTGSSGEVLYRAARPTGTLQRAGLRELQEGLRGVVRIPGGTANALSRGDFPIPVMGKTGTTNHFRDALFVGSTYGPEGITVAVRIGFDDNRSLGAGETGGRAALPIFREIMLRTYADGLAGPVPGFPQEMDAAIDDYRARTGRAMEALRALDAWRELPLAPLSSGNVPHLTPPSPCIPGAVCRTTQIPPG
jgi:penicillin-binding protein 1A